MTSNPSVPPEQAVRSARRRVGVICGGPSAEHAISLATGKAVFRALTERGHDARLLLMDHHLDRALRTHGIEVAFLATHGSGGEDGCLQGMLEVMGIPYTGSGVLASALAMNKAKAKEVFRLHNLPTPPSYVIQKDRVPRLASIHQDFGFPVIAKPVQQGSSLGVALARDLSELVTAVNGALRYDRQALIERHIQGTELSVAILGDSPLGAIEISHDNAFFGFNEKYAGARQLHVPPRLSPDRLRGALALALAAHRALGCVAFSRVDLIVSDLGNEYILEVNTLPGLTPESLMPRIARAAGLSFPALVDEILFRAGNATYPEPKEVSFRRRGGSAASPAFTH
jgi:D-alanine-D-alanine ligase